MKKFTALFLLATSLQGMAQKAKPDAYAKTITPADLKKHLYIIAAPDMEGRETGTAGQRKAAAYIEGYFKSLGLQPGNGANYQQYYTIYQDTLLSAAIEVGGTRFELDKDFTTANSNNAGTWRFSEVVVMNAGATDSLKTADLAGHAVLVLGTTTQAFMQQLLRKSPGVVLAVSSTFPRSIASNRKAGATPNPFRRTAPVPQFSVSESVAKAIAGDAYEAVKSTGSGTATARADVAIDLKKSGLTTQASDVIGLLPGTDLKDEYVVLSAHYDHLGIRNGNLYPGADDDGSGTVSILELAEAFTKASKEGKGPRRSIIFLANSGEEKGLWGSEYYTNHPLFPLDKTTVDLNIDMIGRSDPDRKPDTLNYVYVVGDDKLSSDLKPISEAVNNKYIKMQLDYKYNDPNDKERIYYRSDHYNFARKGVPIIFYYDGMLRPDYHKPTDTPDKINYELMSRRAQLVFYTGWEMANRDAMLKRDIPLDKPAF